MTAIVKPDVRAVVDGVTVPIDGGDVTLDQKAVPYASAQIVLPLTPDTALEDLDPRDGDRITIRAANTGTWAPTYTPWVERRRNRAVNPSFASGAATNWNNWTPGGGGTGVNSVSPTGGAVGPGYRRWTVTTPGNGILEVSTALPNDPVDVTAGQVLTLSMYVRSTKAVRIIPRADYFIRSGPTAVAPSTGGTAVTLVPNAWTRVSVLATIPATATAVRMAIQVAANVLLGAGDTVDVSSHLSELSSTLGPYFDGSTQPASPDTEKYRWAGTANASASIYETREAGDPLWTPATPRIFDLGIRSRTIHHDAKTVDIDLASDETILQDYAVLADDITPFTLTPYLLRGVVNYVLGLAGLSALQPGPDADVTPYWAVTNLQRNPAVVTNLNNWSSPSGATMLWVASGGSGEVQLTATAATGSVFAVDTAKWNLNATPGDTYVFGVAARTTSGAATGVVTIRFRDINGVTINSVTGPAVALTTTFQRVQVVAKAPANADNISIHFSFDAAVGRVIRLDAALLYAGDPRFTVAPFTGADGPRDGYTFAFQGPANDSPSDRIPVVERDPALLLWTAGTTAWDFLQPLLTQAGMRLWCDELRRWWMMKPENVTSPGYAIINGSNATYGDDTVSREDAEVFATGVLVKYGWVDAHTKMARTASDAAGTPAKVFVIEYDTPYPGPGAAQAILARRNGTGRVMDVEGLAQWSLSPAMETSITMPHSLNQQGRVTAVRFSLGDDALMRVTTAGLIDIPPGAWAGWDAAQQWAQVGATVTWASLP